MTAANNFIYLFAHKNWIKYQGCVVMPCNATIVCMHVHQNRRGWRGGEERDNSLPGLGPKTHLSSYRSATSQPTAAASSIHFHHTQVHVTQVDLWPDCIMSSFSVLGSLLWAEVSCNFLPNNNYHVVVSQSFTDQQRRPAREWEWVAITIIKCKWVHLFICGWTLLFVLGFLLFILLQTSW